MQISKITRTNIVKTPVRVDEHSVITLIPDSGLKIWDSVYNSNFLLSNCGGVIVPNKIWNIFRKTFNGRIHYLNVRKSLSEAEDVSRRLKVLSGLPGEVQTAEIKEKKTILSPTNNQFYFFDGSMLVNAAETFLQKDISPKVVYSIILSEIEKIYSRVKRDNVYTSYLVFHLDNPNGILYNFLNQFKKMETQLQDLLAKQIFDQFCFVSIAGAVIPVIEYIRGSNEVIISNLVKVSEIMDNIDVAKTLNDEPAIDTKNKKDIATEEKPSESIVTDIVKHLSDPTLLAKEQFLSKKEDSMKNFLPSGIYKDIFSNLSEPKPEITKKELTDTKQNTQNKTTTPTVSPNEKPLAIKATVKKDTVDVQLDIRTLSKILKLYKITDPDVVANVKGALDTYIHEFGIRPSQEKAELLVLKAINYTVHGTDEIDQKYLQTPAALINKLSELDVYRKKLEFPKGKVASVEPSDIIDLKSTTGQHRQEFEFNDLIHDNIKKVFGSLETQGNHPIKVVDIKHEYKDTDTDRFINYTVTLQNLTSKNNRPYVVEIKVPTPVSEKYFKMAGHYYIFSSQQHMKPITKTDRNEVRILTNYAIARVGVQNLKFNISDIHDIADYINQKYPNLIKEITDKYITFNDGEKIYFTGNLVYETPTKQVVIDSETNKLKDTTDNKNIDIGRFEFSYEIILNKIQKINPEDFLTRTKKSIPYIYIYLGGSKMPLITYIWSQKGLLSTLNTFGINYELNKEAGKKGEITLDVEDGQFLHIYPKTARERLVANGLIVSKPKYLLRKLDDREEIREHIVDHYGSRAAYNVDLMTQNMIDPVTKDLLEFENLPTNLPALSSETALNLLLNKKQDSLADLKIYRSRMSEIILRLMYKQLMRAHNHYVNRVSFGEDDAKLMIVPDFVLNEFLSRNPPDQTIERNAVMCMQEVQPVNPVEEIMLASKVIKQGPGGVPDRKAFTPAHRNVHPSQVGIIAATSTPESAKVGIITHHTLTPLIVNKYGSYGVKDPNAIAGWNVVSADESLIPLHNQIYSDRASLAVTHSKQVTPVNNAEPPLVATGAEWIIPQITSTRFCHKAKNDGVVINVIPNETMEIEYKDGSKETFDIIPRKSRTKRGSFIALEMKTPEVGQKVRKNEIVAHTKNFDGATGMYTSGKNVTVAVMNYNGLSHEDAYVISKELADETTTDVIKEVEIIVPTDTRILNLEKTIGKVTKAGDILVEFSYEDDLEEYLAAYELDIEAEDGDNIITGGRSSIKLPSPGGQILDIKVWINDKLKSDEQLINLHKFLVERTTSIKSRLEKGKKEEKDRIRASDNLDQSFFKIGGHKRNGQFKGIRVVYSIKLPKPIREGDKLASRYGAKGVVSKVYEKKPIAEVSGGIDVFISPLSVLGRKNVALIKEVYLGKLTFALNEKVIKMANTANIKGETIMKLITDYYKILCSEKVQQSIQKRLSSYKTPEVFKKIVASGQFKLFTIVEPFHKLGFESIKTAANLLNIPLDEKVTIITEDGKEITTDRPVPVGRTYMQFLEHYSSVYASVGGAQKYSGLSKQPMKIGSGQNVSAIGELDINALITYNADNILKELLTARSDHHKAKRQLYSDIMETGNTGELTQTSGVGGTAELKFIYMKTLGLDIV